MLNRCLSAAALLVAATAAGPANASLVVAPPILGKGLEPARDIIVDAIQVRLKDHRIRELPADNYLAVKLSQCKNKMSCLSDEAKPAGATLVLHTILARRADEVLAQITLVDVDSSKPVETIQTRSGLGLSLIEAEIKGALDKIVVAIKALPAYQTGPLQLKPAEQAALAKPAVAVTPAPPPEVKAPPKKTEPPPTPPPLPTVSSPFGAEEGGEEAPPPEADPAVVASRVPMLRGTNYLAISFGGAGLALAVGGGVSFILSVLDVQERDQTPQTEVAARQRLRESALQKQTIGAGLVVGGALGLGLGALFWATGWGASEYPAGPGTVSAGPSGLTVTF